MAVLQASVTLFAHIIGALLIATGIWGMQDASASKNLTHTPPSDLLSQVTTVPSQQDPAKLT